ncbi:MAG: hypothetical protein E7Z83_08825 [Methanobrevibacter sp.]|nr:hypothetical protein [Methanobrevibacter sp.]MBE6490943.1 hypothetical protein [Methanobrevibacter sp.]
MSAITGFVSTAFTGESTLSFMEPQGELSLHESGPNQSHRFLRHVFTQQICRRRAESEPQP